MWIHRAVCLQDPHGRTDAKQVRLHYKAPPCGRVLTPPPPCATFPQDDRLRTPLLKLKLAVCSVMPEQIARYNMDCLAKVAK